VLTMRDHNVQDYAILADMDATAVGVLSEHDRACLEELGQYLGATDAWKRFGIWLLHKHFEPSCGEVFVERAIHASRKTVTSPIRWLAFRKGELSATAIRFDDSLTDGVGLIGMEFTQREDFGDTAPLTDDDETVLAGIAARLAAHDKTLRFGVRLIRNPLGLTQHEVLHETSDSVHRTLHCNVRDRRTVLASQTVVETAWRWRLVEGKAAPAVMGECAATCARAFVGGHDIAHTHSEPDDFGDD
jgi:hypothetical protein